MERDSSTTPVRQVPLPGTPLAGTRFVLLGFITFLVAVAIHTRFQPLAFLADALIYPAVVFTLLLLWKRRLWLLLAAVVSIAGPALVVFEPAGLAEPVASRFFLNQLLLLLATVISLVGATLAVRARARKTPDYTKD